MRGNKHGYLPAKLRSRATLLLIASVLLQGVACASAAKRSPPDAGDERPLFTLSSEQPIVHFETTKLLGSRAAASYLRFTVEHISNPQKLAVIFNVYVDADTTDARLIGTFAPFPADNPGKFLLRAVPQIRTGQSISVQLDLVDPAPPQTGAVRVTLLEPEVR